MSAFNIDKFKDYLEDNLVLKEVIEISQKYRQKRLNLLIANDESFALFLISTFFENMKLVSHHDHA